MNKPTSTSHSLHSILYTRNSTLDAITCHTLRCPLHTLNFTLGASHSTIYTLHLTHCTSHSALYTAHSTLMFTANIHNTDFTVPCNSLRHPSTSVCPKSKVLQGQMVLAPRALMSRSGGWKKKHDHVTSVGRWSPFDCDLRQLMMATSQVISPA